MKNIYFTDVAIKITIYSILFIIILITYINAIKKEKNKDKKKNITIKFIIIQLILLNQDIKMVRHQIYGKVPPYQHN